MPDGHDLLTLIQAILRGDSAGVGKLLTASPRLATQPITTGATRQSATDYFLPEIQHYLYAGDTPLHAAAAGYHTTIARDLVRHQASISARNRRGAEPLHYASDGGPGSRTWNPRAQAEMVSFLIQAGANPNALDKSGVAPLHRAVRQRCTGAVKALLQSGAHVNLKNKSGSTPLHLAVQNTGRGGSGTAESKACQEEIIRLLVTAGADVNARDAKGKPVRHCVRSEWIMAALSG